MAISSGGKPGLVVTQQMRRHPNWPSPDTGMALYGRRKQIRDILYVLRSVGILPVCAVMKDEGEPSEIDGLQCLRMEEYVERFDSPYRSLIVASTEEKEQAWLPPLARDLRQKWGFRGRIVHPASLAELATFKVQKAHVSGFPGSGNMVLQRLLTDLSSGRDVYYEKAESLLAGYAGDYFRQVDHFMKDAFKDFDLPIERERAIFRDVWAKFFYSEDFLSAGGGRGRAILMFGLPAPFGVSGSLHASHEPIDMEAVAYWRQRGFKCFVIVRHPLDVIVSNAAKMTNWRGDRYPQALTQNWDWVMSMAGAIEQYFYSYLESWNFIDIYRYEDLGMGLPFVRRLADSLGTRHSEQALMQIYERSYGKPVGTAGHLWRPNTSKHQQYFTKNQIESLRGTVLAELAREFGYEFEAESCPEQVAPAPGDMAVDKKTFTDLRYWGVTGKNPVLFGDSDVSTYEGENLRAVYVDESLGARARTLDEGDDLKTLSDSLFLGRCARARFVEHGFVSANADMTLTNPYQVGLAPGRAVSSL